MSANDFIFAKILLYYKEDPRKVSCAENTIEWRAQFQ